MVWLAQFVKTENSRASLALHLGARSAVMVRFAASTTTQFTVGSARNGEITWSLRGLVQLSASVSLARQGLIMDRVRIALQDGTGLRKVQTHAARVLQGNISHLQVQRHVYCVHPTQRLWLGQLTWQIVRVKQDTSAAMVASVVFAPPVCSKAALGASSVRTAPLASTMLKGKVVSSACRVTHLTFLQRTRRCVCPSSNITCSYHRPQ